MDKVKDNVKELLTSKQNRAYDLMAEEIATRISKDGLNQEMFLRNPDLANRFKNFIDKEIIANKDKLAKEARISQKLAVFYVKGANGEEIGYPVVNVYKRHLLRETLYFRININDINSFDVIHIKMPKL